MEVNKVTKTFVQFHYPGIIATSEGDEIEVPSRDIENLSIPVNAIGFKFFDRTEAIIDGKSLKSEIENKSGWFYIGEELDFEQVTKMNTDKQYDTLLWNMDVNGYKTVAKTIRGCHYPVEENDQVIQRRI